MGDRHEPPTTSLSNDHPSSHDQSWLNAGVIGVYLHSVHNHVAAAANSVGIPALNGRDHDQPSILLDSRAPSPAQPIIQPAKEAARGDFQDRHWLEKLLRSRAFDTQGKRNLATILCVTLLGTVITISTLSGLHILPHSRAQSVPSYFINSTNFQSGRFLSNHLHI
jgi:hypothetical protein